MSQVDYITKFSDLLGVGLDGWYLRIVYFLELRPDYLLDKNKRVYATTSEGGVCIFVINKQDLEIVWKSLPQKPAKVSFFVALVHETGKAFASELGFREDLKPFRVFSSEDIMYLSPNQTLLSGAQSFL